MLLGGYTVDIGTEQVYFRGGTAGAGGLGGSASQSCGGTGYGGDGGDGDSGSEGSLLIWADSLTGTTVYSYALVDSFTALE